MEFKLPPRARTADGRMRLAGFELEFNGVEIHRAAELVARRFGGSVRSTSRFTCLVEGTEFGDFKVEVDASLLKEARYRRWLDHLGLNLDPEDWDAVEEALMDLASFAIPFEVISPPIPMDRLDPFNQLSDDLREHQARGTGASPLYAFGMQFNPEAPDLTADTLLGVLRAFLLLYDWLKEAANIDLSRRIAPYINEFPGDYVRLVLNLDYTPGLERLVEDYLAHNPTRNRPLDMLPLFAHLDQDRVLASAKEPHLVKPRPAFHYRLPDCRIDDPQWSPAQEWNRWVVVERLANNPAQIAELARQWAQEHASPWAKLRRLAEEWFGQ
jgi:hypothetical protein